MAKGSIKVEFSEESREAIADLIEQTKLIQQALDRIGHEYVKQARRSADALTRASKAGRKS